MGAAFVRKRLLIDVRKPNARHETVCMSVYKQNGCLLIAGWRRDNANGNRWAPTHSNGRKRSWSSARVAANAHKRVANTWSTQGNLPATCGGRLEGCTNVWLRGWIRRARTSLGNALRPAICPGRPAWRGRGLAELDSRDEQLARVGSACRRGGLSHRRLDHSGPRDSAGDKGPTSEPKYHGNTPEDGESRTIA